MTQAFEGSSDDEPHLPIILAALLAIAILAGCGGGSTGSTPPTSAHPAVTQATAGTTKSFGIATLAEGLSASGVNVRETTTGGENLFGSAADSQVLWVDQSARIQVFTFASEGLARKAASQVSKDGSGILKLSVTGKFEGGGQYDWMARVHLYRRGSLIAFFMETGSRPAGQAMTKKDAVITAALEKVMGGQFAGM